MIRVGQKMIQPKHVHVIFKTHIDIAYTDLESDQVYPLGRFQVVFTGIRARLEPSAISARPEWI
jgi:hypothetical protein